MIDQNLKPWLLEINQSPSFATDSTFDYALKRKLTEDTFKLLNLTPERKKIYNEQKEKQHKSYGRFKPYNERNHISNGQIIFIFHMHSPYGKI